MTEQEKIMRGNDLRHMTQTIGWRVLVEEIQSRKQDLWERFIDLPVANKTSDLAHDTQGRFDELKRLLAWVNDEIKAGEQSEAFERRRKEKDLATTQ